MATDHDVDVIVIGCGGFGSAACYWLARAGARVLGLEQFGLGHHRGGSQDHSRIIRLVQHEADYVALAKAAYGAWAEVEAESGVRIVTPTGGLVIEVPDEVDHTNPNALTLARYERALDATGVGYERLDADELVARWPQLRLAGDERGLYQEASGIVDAARANATHVALARARGATVLDGTTVEVVEPDGDGVRVRTDHGTFTAQRAVVTSGAWTNRVLADAGIRLPLTVRQEQVTYYATPHLAEFAVGRFPVFMWKGRYGFYGFPVYGEVATKLGQHMGGPVVSADTRTFDPDPVRVARYRAFLDAHIPRFAGPELSTKTCLYTVTPDEHLVLDTVPGAPQMAVAIGAGHGFKYATLIGRIMADLALHGRTSQPTERFRLDRPALAATPAPVTLPA